MAGGPVHSGSGIKDGDIVSIKVNRHPQPFGVKVVIDSENGIKRVELRSIGNINNTSPDLFVYSYALENGTPALRGIYIADSFQGEGLMRPLLNIFFMVFPEVERVHAHAIIPPLLALLIKEYGFTPPSGLQPNAYIARDGRREVIYFGTREAKRLFFVNAPPHEMSRYDVVDQMPLWARPVRLGDELILTDRELFQNALSSPAIEIRVIRLLKNELVTPDPLVMENPLAKFL